MQACWNELVAPVDSVCIISRQNASSPFRLRYRIPLAAPDSLQSVQQVSQSYIASVGPVEAAMDVYPTDHSSTALDTAAETQHDALPAEAQAAATQAAQQGARASRLACSDVCTVMPSFSRELQSLLSVAAGA
jgi:hypothetical protein